MKNKQIKMVMEEKLDGTIPIVIDRGEEKWTGE